MAPSFECIHPWTLPRPGPLWNPQIMWCPWCGERITLGVVTPGGIVLLVLGRKAEGR
jgi:hypothetical protein